MTEVRRFAIKLDPPTFVVEHTKNHKMYVRRIKLQGINANVTETSNNIEERIRLYTDMIIDKNMELLGPQNGVSRDQIEDLIRMILTKSIATTAAASTASLGKTLSSTKDTTIFTKTIESTAATTTAEDVDLTSFGDLNKASDEVVEKAKAIMSVDFEAKRLKPGDEGYVWDKQVDFEPSSGVSEWDEDDD